MVPFLSSSSTFVVKIIGNLFQKHFSRLDLRGYFKEKRKEECMHLASGMIF